MLNQILVLSSQGPCFVSRNYNREVDQIDPQLISAMVSLNSVGEVKLSTITQILEQENDNLQNYALEVNNTYNYITCAITSSPEEAMNIKKILPKINQMIYEVIGNPYQLLSIESKIIKKMEDRIDIILTKEGIIGG